MGPQDRNEDNTRSGEESQQHGEHKDSGHSGEGAASALRHMISQGDRQRHQSGEADDAAGHRQ
jgi:hypothetical protein